MTKAIEQVTHKVSEESLKEMPLHLHQLPEEISGFSLLRESTLSNKTMATHGFPGKSEEDYYNIGRITGYLREFASASAIPQKKDGADIVAATVVHLFKDEKATETWMNDVFINQFLDNIGHEVGENQKLVAVEKLEIDDFYYQSVGVRAIQDGEEGVLSTTVIDFSIGRLLGVSFIVTVGDHGRTELVTNLGLELERNIVRELLTTT